jgi:hypothetical protein
VAVTCRVCGRPVAPPRRVYCGASCADALRVPVRDLDTRGRVARVLVRLRDRAAHILFRSGGRAGGPLDDGRVRIPASLQAQIASYEEWLARLDSRGAS